MKPIKIEKATPEKLKQLGADNWPAWECGPSKFPWQYPFDETAHVKKGKAIITTENGEKHEIVSGDLVFFPKGLKCTWEVIEKIEKVYTGG
jgi:uncharacterized protein